MLFPFLPIEHHDIRGLQPFLRVRHQGALGDEPGLFPRGAGIIRPFLLPNLEDQRKLVQRHAVNVCERHAYVAHGCRDDTVDF